MRVMLEIGPKGKKVVAVAPDWPGLARGATTEEAAIERVHSYVPRYAPVRMRVLSGLTSPLAGRILDRIEPVAGAPDPRLHVRATRPSRTPIRVCASVLPQPGSEATARHVETQSSQPALDAPAGCSPTSSY